MDYEKIDEVFAATTRKKIYKNMPIAPLEPGQPAPFRYRSIAHMNDSVARAEALIPAKELDRYKQFVQDNLDQLGHALTDDNDATLRMLAVAMWNYLQVLRAQYDFVRNDHFARHTNDYRVKTACQRDRRKAEKKINGAREELAALMTEEE